MKYKLALILLGIISSSVATIVSQQCWYDVYVLNQAGDVANVGTDCLCPPQNGYQVSQSINKQSSDLERVVVFYYRDKTNNNIYMFTPKKEKQLLIPELTFEKDDDLYKVDKDFSMKLFDTSTITVNVETQNSKQKFTPQRFPYKLPTNAQGPSVVKIDTWHDQKKVPNIATIDDPTWHDQKKVPGIETIDYSIWNDQIKVPGVETIDYSIWNDQKNVPNIATINDATWHDQKNVPKIDYATWHDQKKVPDIETIDYSIWNDQKNVPNVATIDYSTLHDQKKVPNIESIDYSIWYEQKKEPNGAIIDHSINSGNEPVNLVHEQQNFDISPTFMDPAFSDQVEWQTYGQNNKIKNPSVQITETYPNMPDTWDSQVPNLYNFKTWYSQQTTQFPELISENSKYISINEVREHIVNLLKGYGYSITNNQVLNSNGEVVELSNYKLIRVTIRAPDDEQRLSSKVIGIMFVNMSPLKILGVVPLKNTFDETNIQGWDEQNSKFNEQTIHVWNEKIKENTIGNSYEYPLISPNVNGTKSFNGTVANDIATNENEELEKEPDKNTAKNSGNLNTLLKNLRNMFRRVISPDEIFETTRRDSGEEVLPGFRIIGGNAATGSGTPINSKGRSASPD